MQTAVSDEVTFTIVKRNLRFFADELEIERLDILMRII
jgi:hypothetical protein